MGEYCSTNEFLISEIFQSSMYSNKEMETFCNGKMQTFIFNTNDTLFISNIFYIFVMKLCTQTSYNHAHKKKA